PGPLSARYGLPLRSTIVGLSVVRGRLPAISTLGWPSSRTNACMRFPRGTPVSPAMNVPPANHADEGDAEKRLPLASATSMFVVSSAFGRAPSAGTTLRAVRTRGAVVDEPWNFHGSPGRA